MRSNVQKLWWIRGQRIAHSWHYCRSSHREISRDYMVSPNMSPPRGGILPVAYGTPTPTKDKQITLELSNWMLRVQSRDYVLLVPLDTGERGQSGLLFHGPTTTARETNGLQNSRPKSLEMTNRRKLTAKTIDGTIGRNVSHVFDAIASSCVEYWRWICSDEY